MGPFVLREGDQRTSGTNTGYLSVRLRLFGIVLQALIGHTLDKCYLTSKSFL